VPRKKAPAKPVEQPKVEQTLPNLELTYDGVKKLSPCSDGLRGALMELDLSGKVRGTTKKRLSDLIPTLSSSYLGWLMYELGLDERFEKVCAEAAEAIRAERRDSPEAEAAKLRLDQRQRAYSIAEQKVKELSQLIHVAEVVREDAKHYRDLAVAEYERIANTYIGRSEIMQRIADLHMEDP
jgi:hypothetical protein